MENQIIVSSSPHIRTPKTTQKLMLDVLIALCPALIAAIILFGWRSLLLASVCVASCMLFEFLSCKVMKRPNTVGDLSCVVTGLILSFNLPVTFPVWMAGVGSAVAIIVVKEMFGGLGQNIANPAMVARIVLLVSFPQFMSSFVAPVVTSGPDFITSATPLALAGTAEAPSLLNLFLGVRAGCLGETCVLALLIGGVYLIARRVISAIIPVAFIGTVALFTWLSGADPLYYILSGGLVLGAFFMATDYVTSPLTRAGKLIFGIGCGFLTFVIRTYCNLPEGVSYAIVLMNLLVPLIERMTRPRAFGERRNV